MAVARSEPVRAILSVLLAGAVAGCFAPPETPSPCLVRCGPDGLCPNETACRDDGYCHTRDETEDCGGTEPADADAAGGDAWEAPDSVVAPPSTPDAGGPHRETFGGRPGADHPDACVDTYITDAARGASFAGADALRIEGQPVTRTLWRCDLTALPAGAIIERAELMIWTTDDALESGNAMRIYRLRESWDAGEANYDERRNGVGWTTAGAGTGSHDGSELSVLGAATASREYAVELPATTVQGWVEQPAGNYGLVVKSHFNDAGAELVSLEGSADRRPLLAVTWRWP